MLKLLLHIEQPMGAFKKTEDLKDVHTITDSIYQVLLPYITLE
jgi:DNA uptake protein ComE-like DNA-binding protein